MAHLSESVSIKNTSLIVKFEFDHSSKSKVQNPFLAKAELDFACSYLPVSVFFCENCKKDSVFTHKISIVECIKTSTAITGLVKTECQFFCKFCFFPKHIITESQPTAGW